MSDSFDVPGALGEASAPSQPQTSPSGSPDIEALVAAKVQAALEAMQPKLQQEIERKAQSLADKGYARAAKQFGQDKAAIDRLVQLGGLKPNEAATLKKQAFENAFMGAETDAPSNGSEGDALASHKQAVEQHLKQVFGLEPGDLDVSSVIGVTDPNDPRVHDLYAKARVAMLQKQNKARPQDDPVRQARDEYGTLGGLSASGTPTGNNPIQDLNDPDALWRAWEQSRRGR